MCLISLTTRSKACGGLWGHKRYHYLWKCRAKYHLQCHITKPNLYRSYLHDLNWNAFSNVGQYKICRGQRSPESTTQQPTSKQASQQQSEKTLNHRRPKWSTLDAMKRTYWALGAAVETPDAMTRTYWALRAAVETPDAMTRTYWALRAAVETPDAMTLTYWALGAAVETPDGSIDTQTESKPSAGQQRHLGWNVAFVPAKHPLHRLCRQVRQVTGAIHVWATPTCENFITYQLPTVVMLVNRKQIRQHIWSKWPPRKIGVFHHGFIILPKIIKKDIYIHKHLSTAKLILGMWYLAASTLQRNIRSEHNDKHEQNTASKRTTSVNL